jgi:hypothetical protein
MESKAVSSELINIINEWFPGIDYDGYFIAGGFIRSYFVSNKPKDMDIFFDNLEQLEVVKTKLELIGFELKKKTRYSFTMIKDDKTIQLIKNIHGTIQDVFNDFDFTVCQVAVKKNVLYYESSFFDDLENKRLVINEVSLDRCATTLERVVRYSSYGYIPDRKQLNTLIKTIKNTNENDLRIGYRKSL